MKLVFSQPFRLELDGASLFRSGEKLEAGARSIKSMEDVIADESFYASAKKEKDIYFMYRQLALCRMIRYDVTVIPPDTLGFEFVKTLGHYHPVAKSKRSYTEVYEVLAGEAHYVLQIRTQGTVEVVVVKAKKGDKVIIPPNYGHVTINPSKTETLVMANLVYEGFDSDYRDYKKLRGAAYYEKTDGTLVPNESYGKVVLKEVVDAPEYEKRFEVSQLIEGRSLINLLNEKPWLFDFLIDPDKLKYERLVDE